MLDFVERPLLEQRFKLDIRDGNPQLVVVEIDPKSLREIGTWPWKRSLHALLIDRLTAAGAGTVIFDVDFSLASSDTEDLAFEKALARRNGRTVLAAFRQWSDADGRFVDLGPLPRFLPYSEIASANIFPESDGLLWRQPLFLDWNGQVIPSIATSVALQAGWTTDRSISVQGFGIDYSITPDSFERYSFSDVAGGAVDPSVFNGKTVLVGATAVELGDNVATPLYKSLPGVLVQTLAAQSLMTDRALQPLSKTLTYLLLFFAIAAVVAFSRRKTPGKGLVAVIGLNIVIFITAAVIQSYSTVLVPVAPFIVGTSLAGTLIFLIRFRQLAARAVAERFARLKSQAMMANVAKNAFDALIMTNEAGKIETLNLAAERIFNVKQAKANGHSMSEYYVPSKLTHNLSFEEVLKQAVTTAEPLRILCKRASGKAFHADLAVTRIDEEESGDLILLMRDIDDFVKTERTAIRRERALKIATRQAKLANRAKTEFFANMSHELKTPLNAVMGFAEIMHGELLGPLGSPKYIEYSKDIYDGGAKLLETVTDVLDFARIEDGKLTLQNEQLNLTDLLTRMGEMSRERAEAAGIIFSMNLPSRPFTCTTDQRLLKKALGAILSNAVKFNQRDGQVELAACFTEDGDIRISISDSGIGIPAEEIETCFSAFGQADRGLQRQYEGAGLGLSLALKYIEALGGTLQIKSEVGVGTTVTMILPGQQPEQAEMAIAG
ncbi:CHASE2 domain-containing protein [Sneathiella marina]|uniref:histidine kinase n=2 Tax=Sneathiella marina TaxID=2950108 RepID=A0ABY4VZW3_9PROT|nr:CHASE2 domain-containing protein [Sneathiella marina]